MGNLKSYDTPMILVSAGSVGQWLEGGPDTR